MKIVENRKKFFAASLIVIIIGFAAMIFNAQAGRGAFQYDVEFTGGTSFDLDLGQEYEQEDLQKKFYEVSSKVYGAAGAQGAPQGEPQSGAQSGPAGDDGYVDADYKEVDDSQK